MNTFIVIVGWAAIVTVWALFGILLLIFLKGASHGSAEHGPRVQADAERPDSYRNHEDG